MNQATIDSELTLHGDPVLIEGAMNAHTFDNPRYLQAVRHGRATNRIPSLLEVYRSGGSDSLTVPRGYLEEIRDQVNVIDWRTDSACTLSALAGVTLRDYQAIAATTAAGGEQGLIVAPTGSGKTFIGLELIRQRGQRALILVHTSALADQWRKVIKEVMGVEAGTIGGGKWNEGEEITVAMLQTLHRNPEKAAELFSRHGLTLVDETHRIAAQTFSEVIGWSSTLYRYGLTATPHRRDGLHDLIHRSVGDVIATIHPDQVEQQGGIVPATVKVIQTGFTPSWAVDSWSEYITELVESADRNLLIAIIASQASESAPTLILTERVDHVGYIAANLDGALEIHGKLPAKERRSRIERIAEHQITIGTTGLLGEGLDVSGWGVLIMATPISSKVRLLQAIGRVIRPHPGKQRGYIADLVDDHGFSGSSRNKRLSIYEERGFDVVR